MKKIDRLIATSFIPPFIVAFMIAMFVLVMQVLWLYIDDIAGKGLGMFLVIELISYKSLSLVPMALPLAVLIASVMVLGSMGEHYELSSLKSAGVPLSRIMRPLILFGVGTVLLSFFCSNNFIPVANLKFGSRMYDIQKQKPALSLDAGVFNDDFDGYAIHIGSKAGDGKGISEVLIYDHSDANKGRLSQIVAEEGEMYATSDGRYFLMNLYDGHQYMEGEASPASSRETYPFVRTNFKSWFKVFDLSEFSLNRTNEELFKSNRSMMTSAQLQQAIDSLDHKIKQRKTGIANQVSGYFHVLDIDSSFLESPEEDELIGQQAVEGRELERDSLADSLIERQERSRAIAVLPDTRTAEPGTEEGATESQADTIDEDQAKADSDTAAPPLTKPGIAKGQIGPASATAVYQPQINAARKPAAVFEGRPMEQQIEKPLEEYESILALFPAGEHNRLANKSKSFIRSIQAHSESAERSIESLKVSRVKHIYERHTKYSMALVCFIFVFIGAPMGAIVRKGGFGYPILISIIFFMIFIVLTMFCREVAESYVIPAAASAWIPCGIMFPIGVILTSKAMNDNKLVNTDQYFLLFQRFIKRFQKHDSKATLAS